MTPDQLPEPARAKLAAVEQQATDAQALMHAGAHRLDTWEARVRHLTQVLDTVPSAERRQQAEKEMATARTELTRLREQQQQRATCHRSCGNLVGRLRGYISTLPVSAVVEPLPPARPELLKGEAVPEAITRVRNELFAAQSQLTQLRAAPPTVADLKQMAKEAVATLGAPSLQVQGGKLDIAWPKDPVAFLAWLNAEQVVARLHQQIDRLPVQANALSAAERSRRMTEISARILELEHQEEALVEAALEAGHDGVSRREGVSPAVVLGVRVSTRARAAA